MSPKGGTLSMSTHLSHRSLSRLISRLDQYASIYQLSQKLLAEDSSNFDSKGSFRSVLDAPTIPKVPHEGDQVSTGDTSEYDDKSYLSELSTFCLQEYN